MTNVYISYRGNIIAKLSNSEVIPRKGEYVKVKSTYVKVVEVSWIITSPTEAFVRVTLDKNTHID